MGKCLFLVIFTMLMILNKYTGCNSTVVYIQEGKVAKLIFQYPCDSTEVTLRHGYQTPFYNSENPELSLLPPNKHVLHVNQNISGSEKCSIHLTIDPVSRDDVGTYILTVYKNDVMLPEYPRIGLRVTYPPGKASCESSNDYNDGEWVSLHCTAPLGTIAGQIICYQNGMRLPKLTQPVQDRKTLSQVIFVRLADPVFCCSSTLDIYRNSSDCKDFAWDPIFNVALTDFSDAVLLSTQDLILPNDHTYTDPTLLSTPKNATEKFTIQEKCLYPNYALYISTGILILVIMILALLAVMHCRKIKENQKLTAQLHERDIKYPSLVYTRAHIIQ